MSINTVLIGPNNSLPQNVVFALPARRCWLISDQKLQFSQQSSTGFADVTATTTGTEVSSGFVQNTNSTTANVTCKTF